MANRVRASFDDSSILVYQAYEDEIADAALKAGRFVAPFGMGRMTWIKPSFFWMMYRCGFATKPGQQRVLGIRIKRSGFDWALQNAVLSHFDPDLYASREAWKQSVDSGTVRVQWDPDRGPRLERLDYRAIQIGLRGEAVNRYVNDWTISIEDFTQVAHEASDGNFSQVPEEQVYPIHDLTIFGNQD
jgi:hypothetical protein